MSKSNRQLVIVSLLGGIIFIPRVAVTYLPVHLLSMGVASYVLGFVMIMFGLGYFVGARLMGLRALSHFYCFCLFQLLLLLVFIVFLHFSRSIIYLSFFIGISLGFLSPSLRALLLRQHGKKAKISVYRVFLNVFSSAALIVFSLLAAKKYSGIVWIVLVTIVIGLTLSLFLKKEYRCSEAKKESMNKKVRSNLVLRVYCCFDLLVNVIYSQFYLLCPIYLLTVYHIPLINFAVLGMVNTLAIMFFEYLVSKRLESSNPLLVLSVGAGLIALSEGLMPFGRGEIYLYLIFIPFILGEILYFPASAMVPKQLSENQLELNGFVSISSSWRSLSLIISPLVFAVTHNIWHGDFYWYCSLGFSMLAIVSFVFFFIKNIGGVCEDHNYCR